MKTEFYHEPELQFGYGKHIDIRFGLMNYSPFDVDSKFAPKKIRIGIVGTNQTIEGVSRWLERCKSEIPAKVSNRPNLFPKFCGFNLEVGFKSELVLDSQLDRAIPPKDIDKVARASDKNRIVTEAAEFFLTEVQYLAQNKKPDVILCALPQNLVNSLFEKDPIYEAAEPEGLAEEEVTEKDNFRRFLKGKAMPLRTPLQIVLPHTYDENARHPKQTKLHETTQDTATRAWNFFTAIYYKANGTPWRLTSNPTDPTTCFVGVSFYKTRERGMLQTSLAQIFNERGTGVILRGARVNVSKDDRQPHLTDVDASKLLEESLNKYKQEHGNLPARIVLHKSSNYTYAEVAGFRSAIESKGIQQADFLTILKSSIRLLREGCYPTLRGTKINLDDRTHFLYTRGSIEFFQTYPGKYVPRTLEIRCVETQQTSQYLCNEILALTKMNWNNTQFDGGLPITLRCAYQVGDILKYVDDNTEVEPRYSFYM